MFLCQVCDSEYLNKITLNSHVLTAHGGYNYKCDICKKYGKTEFCFTLYGQLKKHLESDHGWTVLNEKGLLKMSYTFFLLSKCAKEYVMPDYQDEAFTRRKNEILEFRRKNPTLPSYIPELDRDKPLANVIFDTKNNNEQTKNEIIPSKQSNQSTNTNESNKEQLIKTTKNGDQSGNSYNQNNQIQSSLLVNSGTLQMKFLRPLGPLPVNRFVSRNSFPE
ncbi:hypothetical protein RFI_09344 [Reticulomyxa filosa]|uniref:C2H2-type domain-containing protein n=1 Tax=Reticulomyxa filosa TaxID=46433 RepID=X6NR09_RETFI|nr:hypothetical protein RFI_09344 [Reticulomyxa filosa]|eukprot:ETO27787.1 hypothetical protein RFI_09344 [Reticulomyxa filosa]